MPVLVRRLSRDAEADNGVLLCSPLEPGFMLVICSSDGATIRAEWLPTCSVPAARPARTVLYIRVNAVLSSPNDGMLIDLAIVLRPRALRSARSLPFTSCTDHDAHLNHD